MKLEITKQRETPLLSRKRVTLVAEYEGTTPSRIELRKEIAAKMSVDEKLIIIKHIYTRFGMRKAKIICHVYDNLDELKKFEHVSLLTRHLSKAEKEEAKKAAAAAAEQQAAKA